ncbi:NUDIX domain-containing protein [Anaerobacillus sp. MEB173]|uniref:NUDIX domain-containing protein n=1 Tax=Anaerobacillus sp. MEB173 TaxID=3383345 RepID=UPI003F8F1B33
MKTERGNVWLAAAGIVIKDGKWLVVEKKYGGLKGKWSFPAGFVNGDETVDEAVQREVLEETGIKTSIIDIVGVRTGVINHSISDNMIVFLLEAKSDTISIQPEEIECAVYLSPEQLKGDPKTSTMIHFYLEKLSEKRFNIQKGDPGAVFGYTKYKLFY